MVSASEDDLLDALGNELKQRPDWKLLWVGDGWLKEKLYQRLDAMGLRKQVVTTGLVPSGRVPFFIRAMDVLVPGVGEIIGGSQREHRLDMLEARMHETGLNPAEYWWYVDLRRYGTVPHAGFGLGLERMLLLLTGMQNIRDVIPFPRTPKNAEF